MSLKRFVQVVPESIYLSILNGLVSYKISNIAVEEKDARMFSAGMCLFHFCCFFFKWSKKKNFKTHQT